MAVESWDDIRTALAVARNGTVSGAAQVLGVHHATVIRRIDALEEQLGARLFQRHPRGYALTEAGQALLKAAEQADERFAQMSAQIAGGGDRIEGDLIITSLPELADLVMPRLIALMRRHPTLRLRYLTDPRLFRLDAGEAHLAIRAGAQPTEPDYVVRPMAGIGHHLYAAAAYRDEYGALDDVTRHRFVLPGSEGRGAPYVRWLRERVGPENIVMVSNDSAAREAMIRAGLAMGWLPDGAASGLIRAMTRPEWSSDLWLVTHVDLHRTSKVQAALAALRGRTPPAGD